MSQPPDDLRPGLKPPQFHLGTLMWAIAGLCAVLALMNAVGPFASLVLALFLVAVIAHVAGNAIGTRMRENGDANQWPSRRRRPSAADFAPATTLRHRTPLRWTILVTATLGVIVGGTAGGLVLAHFNIHRATVANISFGALSFAVLGGLWGALIGSFVRVTIVALRQIHEAPKRR